MVLMARPHKADQVRGNSALLLCDEQIVHMDAVRTAREHLPTTDAIASMSALFGALGDPTRLRVVAALAAQELCVCDLAATLGVSQSAVSHQLRLLRSLGLIRPRREGRLVYYSLDDAHVSNLFDQAMEHVNHAGSEGEA